MTRSDIHALSGAYALDAVDDLERAAFERHLRDCPACLQEVRELRETVTRLADSTAAAPPHGLRGGVLAAVARTPQVRPGRADRGSAAAVTRWRRFAAASVAACVVAGGIAFGTWSIADQRVDKARAEAEVERARAAAMQRILSAPDVRTLATNLRGGGRVNVVVSPSQGAAVALLSELPTLPGKGVFELWLADGGLFRSIGPLSAGAREKVQLIPDLGGADVFGVSQEPDGGAPDKRRPTAVVGAVGLT